MDSEPLWSYPCPACGSTFTIHDEHCRFEGEDRVDIERAYIDIISPLVHVESVRRATLPPDAHDTITTDFDWLQERVEESPGRGGWTNLHSSVLGKLKRFQHVVENPETENFHHVPSSEREYESEPTFGDIGLVYEYGACNGCLDAGSCAIMSWCEMRGFSWEESVEFFVEWAEESGTWDRGDFAESTPEALAAEKRHVYEEGHGWSNFASTTVRKMKEAGHIPNDE